APRLRRPATRPREIPGAPPVVWGYNRTAVRDIDRVPMNRQNDFLAGGGEMGERIRAMDWSATPLGSVEGWPQSLRSALSHLLPSKAQIAMFWGPELVTLYNDAYRPVFGAKHPAALGAPVRQAWPELWAN